MYGRLVRLDSFEALISGSYFLVMQKSEILAIREFIDWLRKSGAHVPEASEDAC